MDLKRLLKDNRGVSLMEVTLAVAIFAGVIAVTAQSLASFYVSVDMQEQRIEAVNTCRSVMEALREKRRQFKTDFPDGLLNWVDERNEASWDTYLADNSIHQELEDQTIQVECYNEAGDEASLGDNPIVVHVISSWQDRKGRTLTARVVSVLTGE